MTAVNVTEQKVNAELIEALARLGNDAERAEFFACNNSLISSEVAKTLAETVVRKVRVDTHQAVALAEAAVLIASHLHSKSDMAIALRAKANALYASGDNAAAVKHHQEAFEIYSQLHEWKEGARTLSSSIQPLILLGEYDRAFEASERAREIFKELKEPWRIARLEINVGNIYHRQDRFEEALEHYDRAYEGLLPHRDAEGIAVVLSNMAVCLIGLNDFPRALSTYQRARQVCQENDMPLLVAQADYNIAYLYYLRGEYSTAIKKLSAARRSCEATGDHYHFALCHLDLSDVYLELNLGEEAREVAHEGFLQFEKLGMRYEAAKTLANEAMAYGQLGKSVAALERFAKAREMFVQEDNLVWPWLLDIYQALILFQEGRYFEARRLCSAAAAFFDHSPLRSKSVLAHLLLARIALGTGDLDAAAAEAQTASDPASLATPVLDYQVHFFLGQLAHRRGELSAARKSYQAARQALESMRTRIHTEELKISFGTNRMQVYEALVDLYLSEAGGTAISDAFACIESAKSRSMSEMIFRGGRSMPLGDSGQSELVRRIRDLREDLNWYHHRIELEQLNARVPPEGVARLQEEARARENELLRTLRELPSHQRENATLDPSPDFSLDTLQACLPPETALVEYFSTGDRLLAAVVTRESVQVQPVSVLSRSLHFLQLLRFQLSKFRLGAAYVDRFAEPLLAATQAHLESLYDELLAPLRTLLSVKSLVFAPHGPLHFLPFHALRNDGEYLCDSYTISYAPSATIFCICQQKASTPSATPVVFGVPDERAPEILGEVQAVKSLLPGASLFTGEDATLTALRKHGSEASILHLATHGVYRQDNPMFSGIRLADGYLYLYDLYQMHLPARLVTLSGCATGMNMVAAGDELLGLQRGLFCAGAAGLLLSLWDVHDRSTAELMQLFYRHYLREQNAPQALRSAMQELRETHPHPYFWAPFLVSGQATENKPLI